MPQFLTNRLNYTGKRLRLQEEGGRVKCREDLRFEVPPAVSVRIAVYRVVAQFSEIEVDPSFGETYYLHHQCMRQLH